MVTGTLGQTILGGALIGLALAMLTILTGRKMSASGMIASLLDGREGLAAPSIAFIAGLFIAPSILMAFGYAQQSSLEPGWPVLIVGGLLVGIGARLGGGSLLGAIVGLAQMSGRALAMLLAILAGAVVSFVLYELLGIGGAA